MKIRITSLGVNYDLTLPVTIAEIPITPPPDPAVFSIAASPTSITVGQSSTITCAFEHVAGAWLLYGATVKALAGPVSVNTVAPIATTTYALRVKLADGTFDESKKVTVTVTPKPVDPVPTTYRRGVGIHALANGGVVGQYRAAGGNDVCAMQDYDALSRFCDALGKTSALDGKGVVMFREYINYWPTFERAMDYCRPNLDKRIIRIITNESEFCPGGNSVEGILTHAALDVRVARELAKLGIYGACWSGAVGNPDLTKPETQQAFMQGYAAWWNNGLKETGIAPIMDTHTYSPNPTHIYDTWEGEVTMQVPAHAGMRAVQMPAANAIDGMDYLTEIVGRNGTPVVRLAGAGHPQNTTKQPFAMESRTAAIATATMPRTFHMHEQDWHETRPMLWFETSGFNLKSGGRIVVSETGVDQGGKGGFLGCGMTMQDFIRWALKYREIWTRSVGDWFGNYCAMPLEGSVVFQGADPLNGTGHWGSYYIDPPWQAALIAAVRGA